MLMRRLVSRTRPPHVYVTMDQKTEVFESIRPRLFGLAYRMLGIVADAEDVVQEAFLRWRQADEAPRSDQAWLVSVTTRIAIDRLRRAATERAAYRGQWLPEPVTAPPPDQAADLADDLSIAFLLMLERLGPEERAALLLREVFDAEYAEIARVLAKSEAACRQIVHRAKERVRRDQAPFGASPVARERVTRRFVDALRAEDREGLLALMTADAILVADGGGRVPAVAGTQRGAERVAQLLVGFERATRLHLERAGLMPEYELAWLNGDPAVLTLTSGRLLFATVLHLRRGGHRRRVPPVKSGEAGWSRTPDVPGQLRVLGASPGPFDPPECRHVDHP